MHRRTGFLMLLMAVLLAFSSSYDARAQEGKPFVMPVASLAGPSTWLLGQPYGNTVGAYYNGDRWYSAGQRLHFGIDISMPCGTPLVAVGDAEVRGVDDLSFGSGPHNLILRHEAAGVTTLYGHLLERPPLVNGQFVEQGQVIALSGDPDITCDSRPHLHLEVRSLDYRTAYNPVDYISAPWHTLSTVGSFSSQSFQRDLDNPRQWLTLRDQPPVAFGGAALNNYAAPYPAPEQPPGNPPLAREIGALPPDAQVQQRRLGYEGCCFWSWWHPTDASRLYSIDGSPGQRASVYEWIVGGEESFDIIGAAPPPFLSPDATHEIRSAGDQVFIRRLGDGAEWSVPTDGSLPAINPGSTHLMWMRRDGDSVPGAEPPPLEVWVSTLDGQNVVQASSQRGGFAVWLDDSRILLSSSEDQITTLKVYSVSDGSTSTLGAWQRLRGISIAPGGGRLLFYLTSHSDQAVNGMYALDTTAGAVAQKLPWFGAWRWRDANSVYFIPFNPTTDQQMLAYYDIPSGESRMLTDPAAQPLTIANGDWSVSADGQRIVYLNATDLTMWLLEIITPSA